MFYKSFLNKEGFDKSRKPRFEDMSQPILIEQPDETSESSLSNPNPQKISNLHKPANHAITHLGFKII